VFGSIVDVTVLASGEDARVGADGFFCGRAAGGETLENR
jgi:hypothetical protein